MKNTAVEKLHQDFHIVKVIARIDFLVNRDKDRTGKLSKYVIPRMLAYYLRAHIWKTENTIF